MNLLVDHVPTSCCCHIAVIKLINSRRVSRTDV